MPSPRLLARWMLPAFISLVISPLLAQTAQKVTLSGYVKDAANGEELIGVTVYVVELETGIITNPYGFYSLTLPPGTYTVQYRFIGFETVKKTLNLQANTELNVELADAATQLAEVQVVGNSEEEANVQDIAMSKNKIRVEMVKELPALFGEPDIIKNVQMQPGVISAGEGTSAFFVRGGGADQNLILIDEAPVYDPSHFFGLFSVFNADVIKDSELYKGGIPAQFGGRLSSILDVRTKDGNDRQLGGSATVGLLAAKAMVKGPLVKEKASFIVSGRRSYADLFFPLSEDLADNTIYFYDINAKISYKPSNKDRFFLAFYTGRDVFSFGEDFQFGWGNLTATARWNHLFSDKLFSNTTLIFSNFDYALTLDDASFNADWTSSLQNVTFKQDLTWFISPSLELDFAYHGTYRRFAPARIEPRNANSIFETTELERYHALDHAAYVGLEHKVTERLTLRYGLRYSIFQNVGPTEVREYLDPQDNANVIITGVEDFESFETIKTFHNLEPRFAARYLLNDRSSVKASYNRMVQNIHLISNSTVPVPFNTWLPSSSYIEPQVADQVALGYFRNFANNKWEASAEVYYKDVSRVTDFADNAQLFFNEDITTEIRQGTSEAYGLELSLTKQSGRLTGFAAYTLSRAERTIPDVNQGTAFPANHDRRHNFNIVGTYKLNDKWTFGGQFTYTTGRAITLPTGRYEFGENYNVPAVSERNGYRLPDYHRLDLSATLTPRKNKDRKWKGSWTFSIYNVYNRANPFTIYTRVAQDDDGNIIGDGSELEARMVYLFPILPSVSYTIKF